MMITAQLKADKNGFGFTIRGAKPCLITVLPNSIAEYNGLRTGDILIALNNNNVENAEHKKIAQIFAKIHKKKEIFVTLKQSEDLMSRKQSLKETKKLNLQCPVNVTVARSDYTPTRKSYKKNNSFKQQKQKDFFSTYHNSNTIGSKLINKNLIQENCCFNNTLKRCNQKKSSSDYLEKNDYIEMHPPNFTSNFDLLKDKSYQEDLKQNKENCNFEEKKSIIDCFYELKEVPSSSGFLLSNEYFHTKNCFNQNFVKDCSATEKISNYTQNSEPNCILSDTFSNLKNCREKNLFISNNCNHNSNSYFLETQQDLQDKNKKKLNSTKAKKLTHSYNSQPKKNFENQIKKKSSNFNNCFINNDLFAQSKLNFSTELVANEPNLEIISKDTKDLINSDYCETKNIENKKLNKKINKLGKRNFITEKNFVTDFTKENELKKKNYCANNFRLFFDKKNLTNFSTGKPIFSSSFSTKETNYKNRLTSDFNKPLKEITNFSASLKTQKPTFEKQNLPFEEKELFLKNYQSKNSSKDLLSTRQNFYMLRSGSTSFLSDKADLEQILKSETARAPFQQFLQQQFCAENINFYLAVEEYRQIPDYEPEKRAEFGRRIFEKHFANNCIEPVNIDNSTANSIRDAYKKNCFTSTLYDVVQYQIFHLLKYDCWPRYLRAGGQLAEELGSTECGSNTSTSRNSNYASKNDALDSDHYNAGYHGKVTVRDPPAELLSRTCTLLNAENTSSEEVPLKDQLQSVKQWAMQMSEKNGLDKFAYEVVDAQTGTTIDPARQAVDALNNRVVRLMAVVKFPVIFLAVCQQNTSSTIGKSSLPAKAVLLRARGTLTVNKVLTPIMLKYNMEASQAVICFSGTNDIVEGSTPISAFFPRGLTVMSTQQYVERKNLPKRDYQKELSIVPSWMLASASGSGNSNSSLGEAVNAATGLPFHQHGDVGFYEIPLEIENNKGLKHNAIRSHSSNPKEFFKFGRKPSQAKSARSSAFSGVNASVNGSDDNASFSSNNALITGSPSEYSSRHVKTTTNSSFFESDRRKSFCAVAINSRSSETSNAPRSVTSNDSYKLNARKSSSNIHVYMGSAKSLSAQIEKNDIPYCGEQVIDDLDVLPDPVTIATTYSSTPTTTKTNTTNVSSKTLEKRNILFSNKTKNNQDSNFAKSHHAYCHKIPDFLKQDETSDSSTTTTDSKNLEKNLSKKRDDSNLNGSPLTLIRPCVPAIYASAIRSDKETAVTPSEVIERGLEWQKADYV